MTKKSGVSYCPTKEGLINLLASELSHGYFSEFKDKFAEKMIEFGENLVKILYEENFTTKTLYKNQRNNFGLMFYPDGSDVGYNLQKNPYVFEIGVEDLFKILNTSSKKIFHYSFPITLQLTPIYENLTGEDPPYSLAYIDYSPSRDKIHGNIFYGTKEEGMADNLLNLWQKTRLYLDFPEEFSKQREKIKEYIPKWKIMRDICLDLYKFNFKQ